MPDRTDHRRPGQGTGALYERRARPGAWIAVAGDDLTLLLPGSERARAAEFWALVDAGAGAEQVLDALISGGVSKLCAFVLVDLAGTNARVLVRGATTVRTHSAAGRTAIRAGHRVWADEQLEQVERITVDLGAAPAATEEFLLRPGLCRVGALTWGTSLAEPAAPIPVAAPAPTPVLEPTPEPVPEPTPVEEQLDEPLDEPDEDEDESVPDGALPPVVRPIVKRPTPPDPVPVPVIAPVPVPPVPLPPVPLPPVPSPPVPTPVPSPPAEEAPETAPLATSPSVPEWQEDVTAHLPTDELASRLAEEEVEEDIIPFPRTTPIPVGRLVFSHGLTVDVADRVLVVGRAPSVPEGHDGPRPELITVPSPLQEVSSTHVEFHAGTGIDHGAVVVVDLESTNGTVVDQPGELPEELRAGVPVALRPGAVVDLGDGAVVRVTTA